jgi:hypothetical protein
MQASFGSSCYFLLLLLSLLPQTRCIGAACGTI